MYPYRVGDTLPALQILVTDVGQVIDLSFVDVMVRWRRGDGTVIAERQAPAVDAPNGLCQYLWQAGDLSVTGIYEALIQLQPVSSTARYSLTNPPVVQIEVLANDFETDGTFPWLPMPSAVDVANQLQVDLQELDGSRLLGAMRRARRLVYVYGEFWRNPGYGPDSMDTELLKDFMGVLSAIEYSSSPTALYGPYKKETIGSYEYELRGVDANLGSRRKTGNPRADWYIDYFVRKNHMVGVDILFPDWVQPIVARVLPPVPSQVGFVGP